MADYSIKRGDLEPPLRVQLTERDPDSPDPRARRPKDLTGAQSARLKAKSRDHLTVIDGDADIVVPESDGYVEYAWQVGDTARACVLKAEVEIVWSGGRPQTFPNDGTFDIEIEEDRG